MTRRTILILTLPLLLLLAVALFGAWLAGTTGGARWLLRSLAPRGFTAQRVEGRLLDRLRLEGVHLALKEQEVLAERVDLGWRPWALLAGEVAVTDVVLSGVRVINNAPETGKAPDLVLPGLPRRLKLARVSIDRLRVEDFTYRRGEGVPLTVKRLAASVLLRNGLLRLSDLNAVTPAGSVTGSATVGVNTPSLDTDLTVKPATPLAEIDLFTVTTRMKQGKGAEHLAGEVSLAGSAAGKRRVAVSGGMGITRHDFNLYRLRVTRPGERGLFTVNGAVTLTATVPLLTLELQLADVDLAPELKVATVLTGRVIFTGTTARYRGHLDLTNRGEGWHRGRLFALYKGNRAGVTVSSLTGSFLDGTVNGNVEINWEHGLAMSGVMGGRDLNPAVLAADWRGTVNFQLDASIRKPPGGGIRGEVDGRLLRSVLHGQPLTGNLRASLVDDNLSVGRMDLHGRGFDLTAAGELARRLTLSAQVTDLSRMVPGAAGELRGSGWLRYRQRRLVGNLTARGKNLSADGVRAVTADLAATVREGDGYPFSATVHLQQVSYGGIQTDTAVLEGTGTVAKQTVTATLTADGAVGRLTLTGGYRDAQWQGKLTQLAGRDALGPWSLAAPVVVKLGSDRIVFSPFALTGPGTERFTASGDIRRDRPPTGTVQAQWHDLRLSRANPWLRETQLSGATSGTLNLQLFPGERVQLKAQMTGFGSYSTAGRQFHVRELSATVDGGEHGVRGVTTLVADEGGEVSAELRSPEPARLALPQGGDLQLRLSGFDLALLRPWLPPSTDLKGKVNGSATGRLLRDRHLELDGEMAVTAGTLHWEGDEGEVDLNLRGAALTLGWRGETLGGTVALRLAEHGDLNGEFRLPVPARLPIAIVPQGAVAATLKGRVRERGVLAGFFPGVIQESHGEVTADLRVGGTWQTPELGGAMQLAGAGAYLPSAGIRLRDLQLTARLAGDTIQIDSFQAVSGAGRLQGSALVTLKGWKVASYRGRLDGERFQTVFLPELQLMTSPQLLFAGTPQRLQVRGEIGVPEMIVVGQEERGKVVQPSKDVIIEGGEPRPPPRKLPLALDAQVRVVLGDRVLVKEAGIDARLGGSIRLAFKDLDKITSTGEINVIKGSYRTYGVDLNIVRGRLYYSGGALNRPTLDFLALRTSGDVKAGVTIAGTPQAPAIKLYSEPALPDVDILAYIVMGHPLGSSSEQAGLLAGAAGALLSAGQSVVLQDRIRNRLGLSTFGIETTTESGGRMGYKEITPSALGPAKQAPGVSQSLLTVGKYLTPELYISYGRSLFTGGNLFRLRYDIYKNWQIQTETGTESGVDLYYKIDFN